MTHEIGHAVSYFNLEFQEFMEFVKNSGFDMIEFRKYFVQQNSFHQIALKPVNIQKDQWDGLLDRFSMKSVAHNMDVFGEVVLKLRRNKSGPWDENPLETFAWNYEWFLNKKQAFERTAKRMARSGDKSYANNLTFMQEKVFGA